MKPKRGDFLTPYILHVGGRDIKQKFKVSHTSDPQGSRSTSTEERRDVESALERVAPSFEGSSILLIKTYDSSQQMN